MSATIRPPHIQAAVEALRAAGWVEPADCGRSVGDLVALIERGDVKVVRFGEWMVEDVPMVVHMVRRAGVEAAGPVVRLHAVP